MKKSLLETISIQLLREGYTIKNLNSCFDIIARKNTNILLLKIVNDANSLYKESVEEMEKIFVLKEKMLEKKYLTILEKIVNLEQVITSELNNLKKY